MKKFQLQRLNQGIHPLIVFTLSVILYFTLSHWFLQASLRDQYLAAYQQPLIEHVSSAQRDTGDTGLTPDLVITIARQIEQDLTFNPNPLFVTQCRTTVLSLLNQPTNEAQQPWWYITPTRTAIKQIGLVANIDCKPQVKIWLPIAMLIAALQTLLICRLPRPLTTRQHQAQTFLTQSGIVPTQAISLIRQYPRIFAQLTQDQLACFLQSLPHMPVEQALAIAQHESDMFFSTTNNHTLVVKLHGVTIEMAKTPLIYYYWYAQKRVTNEHEGWFTNPAANRPDQVSAESLITLMEQFGGHARAISDLKENGLKAKSLDQNRSKIKEAILAVLPPSLAETYLFEKDNSDSQLRARYRIKLDINKITLT
ncbi:hypothetical protein L4D09_09240 [Photobacterium makurazakiensis]|uniref:hypothetical protein n=1 Tax=Photobacterium makurazakiensis TaxID=2910234 RepID=UPI003D09BED2